MRLAYLCQTHWRRLLYYTCQIIRKQILEPWGPELRCFTVYWLERMSLLSSSATLAEALYGGKRVKLEGIAKQSSSSSKNKTNNINDQRRRLRSLTKQDAIRLALFMALGPYLEERSDVLCKLLMKRISTMSCVSRRTIQRLQTLMQVIWPLVRLTTKTTFWLYQWRYLMGWSVFFDPYSNYLNLVLRRVTLEDQQQQQYQQTTGNVENQIESMTSQQQQQEQQQITSSPSGGESNTVQSVQSLIPPSLRDILSSQPSWIPKFGIGVMSMAVVFSFIARVQSIQQSMQQEEDERYDRHQAGQEESERLFPGSSKKNPIPPPPSPAIPHNPDGTNPTFGIAPTWKNLSPEVCPLCQEVRINPTASVSGYVFCYKCIVDYIKEKELCPVTGKKCNMTNLVRLYEPRT